MHSAVIKILLGRRDVSWKEAKRYLGMGKPDSAATEQRAGDECQSLYNALASQRFSSGPEIQAFAMSMALVRQTFLGERAERLRAAGEKTEAATYQCASSEMRYIAEQIGKLV